MPSKGTYPTLKKLLSLKVGDSFMDDNAAYHRWFHAAHRLTFHKGYEGFKLRSKISVMELREYTRIS